MLRQASLFDTITGPRCFMSRVAKNVGWIPVLLQICRLDKWIMSNNISRNESQPTSPLSSTPQMQPGSAPQRQASPRTPIAQMTQTPTMPLRHQHGLGNISGSPLEGRSSALQTGHRLHGSPSARRQASTRGQASSTGTPRLRSTISMGSPQQAFTGPLQPPMAGRLLFTTPQAPLQGPPVHPENFFGMPSPDQPVVGLGVHLNPHGLMTPYSPRPPATTTAERWLNAQESFARARALMDREFIIEEQREVVGANRYIDGLENAPEWHPAMFEAPGPQPNVDPGTLRALGSPMPMLAPALEPAPAPEPAAVLDRSVLRAPASTPVAAPWAHVAPAAAGPQSALASSIRFAFERIGLESEAEAQQNVRRRDSSDMGSDDGRRSSSGPEGPDHKRPRI